MSWRRTTRRKLNYQPSPPRSSKKKIEILRERKRKLRALGKQMDQSGQTQVSLTDPDSRSIPAGKGHGTDVAYNVQVTVDCKHKLILDHEVTNDPTDRAHLGTMAQRAKDPLGVKRLEAVADMGYYDAQQIKSCAEAGITTFIPKPLTSINRSPGLFTKEDFHYDARGDSCLCPAGQRPAFRFQTRELGRDVRYYATPACAGCRLRPHCTRNAAVDAASLGQPMRGSWRRWSTGSALIRRRSNAGKASWSTPSEGSRRA